MENWFEQLTRWQFVILLCAIGLPPLFLFLSLFAPLANENLGIAAWVQAIGSIAAVGGAAAVGVFQSNREDARRERERTQTRQTSAVVLAGHLRAWLRIAAEAVQQAQLHEDSSGHEGSGELNLPRFEFEYELVAPLRPELARKAFSLMEQNERIQKDIWTADHFEDSDVAVKVFYEGIAKLFWRVRTLYHDIAIENDLAPRTSKAWEIKAIVRAWPQSAPPGISESTDEQAILTE